MWSEVKCTHRERISVWKQHQVNFIDFFSFHIRRHRHRRTQMNAIIVYLLRKRKENCYHFYYRKCIKYFRKWKLNKIRRHSVILMTEAEKAATRKSHMSIRSIYVFFLLCSVWFRFFCCCFFLFDPNWSTHCHTHTPFQFHCIFKWNENTRRHLRNCLRSIKFSKNNLFVNGLGKMKIVLSVYFEI